MKPASLVGVLKVPTAGGPVRIHPPNTLVDRIACYQCGVNRTGIDLMLLTVEDRSLRTGPQTSMSGKRESNSEKMLRISPRARLAPRQKCGPQPKAR